MAHALASRLPAATRSPRRLAFIAMLVLAVAWAFAWGAHRHDLQPVRADLTTATVDRQIVIDASTGSLDLTGVDVRPGEVVEFVLAGSAGSPHAFVLTGASPGAQMDQSVADNGDTVIRLQAPRDGGLSFLCTVPGHEGLHGNLLVTPRGQPQ